VGGHDGLVGVDHSVQPLQTTVVGQQTQQVGGGRGEAQLLGCLLQSGGHDLLVDEIYSELAASDSVESTKKNVADESKESMDNLEWAENLIAESEEQSNKEVSSLSNQLTRGFL